MLITGVLQAEGVEGDQSTLVLFSMYTLEKKIRGGGDQPRAGVGNTPSLNKVPDVQATRL